VNRPSRALLLLVAACALACASVAYAFAGARAAGPTGTATKLENGKRLYRKYCGQCHVLTVALAAGFGSDNGLGTDGGPSFDNLRVPFRLSILAVSQPFIGHERIAHKMTWDELKEVSTFVQTATKHHKVLAQDVDG
jgi:mono/diheme cytochrome c family protein